MRYPLIRQQAGVTVTVPTLNGGINLNDDLSTINDNQLTNADNVWWYRNALRTRPGLKNTQYGSLDISRLGDSYAIDRFVACGAISERESLVVKQNEFGGICGYSLQADGGLTPLGKTDIVPISFEQPPCYGVKWSGNSEGKYYFFLRSGQVLEQGPKTTDGTERELVEAKPYVPLVLVNGKGAATEGELSSKPEGDVYEGYNMLTGQYRCTYSTNGKWFYFRLPSGEVISELKAEITLFNRDDGTLRTISCTLNAENRYFADAEVKIKEVGEDFESVYPKEAHARVRVDCEPKTGRIRVDCVGFDDGGEIRGQGIAPTPVPTVNSNNLAIIVTDNGREAYTKRHDICQMSKCTWFGGDRSGLAGGTRLFVTGNTAHPNLVHWSDVNNPLYFPENNYAYVGDSSEAVTGFGKQGDILVIFKEHEIYYAQYVAGSDSDYEYATKSGVDITTYMAKFPLTPLHSTIGCDCPGSIRLVNNRLVWADSSGRVYMLPTVNQYNERNVREISPNIQAALREHSKEVLRAATAGEYNGYYILLVEDKLYLLDTQNSAFVSFNYYSKENDAQRALPWYIWTLDPALSEFDKGCWAAMVSDGDNLSLLRQPLSKDERDWKVFGVEGDTDEGAPIRCHFTTKLFDFGRKDLRKAIRQLYIGLSDSPESSVRVSYITDDYSAEDVYTLEGNGDHAEGHPGYMRTHRLTPGINRVRLFAVRCDSDGTMAVDGIQIKTKPQGVVR